MDITVSCSALPGATPLASDFFQTARIPSMVSAARSLSKHAIMIYPIPSTSGVVLLPYDSARSQSGLALAMAVVNIADIAGSCMILIHGCNSSSPLAIHWPQPTARTPVTSADLLSVSRIEQHRLMKHTCFAARSAHERAPIVPAEIVPPKRAVPQWPAS